MRKIIYYVAASIDGFIAGPEEDISGFIQQGEGVDQYRADLAAFDTVIMGRKTYEFGYQYGLQPGMPAYSHMQHYIFSETLHFENADERVKVCPLDIDIIHQLKKQSGTDIYLCGGGEFSAWLLEHELIDVLKLKLNPLILGDGVPLFGSSQKQHQLRLLETERYADDLQIMSFAIGYT